MSSGRSGTPVEGYPSHPRYAPGMRLVAAADASSSIRGDYSGNTGYHNIIGSGNTVNTYHGGTPTNSPADCAQILQCLYTSRYEEHRNRLQEPVEGTCIWVTKHPKYEDWLKSNTPGLLWLSADPGNGKSVIASFLVKHLREQTDAIVCYFFFKDDSDEQKSAEFALCAILHQIFKGRDRLVDFAREEFKAKASKFAQEVDTLWDILVKVVAEGGCGDVICVVDALDECEQRTQARFLHHLAGLPKPQNSHIRLKFLVTSRPYYNIERGLGSPATTIRLKGEDEVKAITADVTRVIDEGIESLESDWGQPGGLGYLRDLLRASADRTFIWVSLVLGILRDSPDDSREEFTNIVSTAPCGLAELYTKILDKSMDPYKARRILEIVVAATRPLTLREMNVAFKIRRDSNGIKDFRNLPTRFERTIKNLCGHFVRIIDSKIYLVHQTAREFLIKGSSPGQGNWQYTLCYKDSNFALADICISYLSQEEFENDPPATDNFGHVKSGALKNLVQKYTFLDYAARHWADHFRDSQDRQMELFEFIRLICEAGSKRFLTWLQVYWFNSRASSRPPEDWTHLMMASWLGQGAVVERLLEDEGDMNAQSGRYGTALNIAALRKNEDMTRMLLRKNVKACIGGKEYNILQTKFLIISHSYLHGADAGGLGTTEKCRLAFSK
ncbi:NACHT-ANK domain protein transcript variant 4 [Tuber magnatum]|uniref:NACHT-ANK domain protein transcript variant 4 n=1 Tax=Tuber magnatum TaxID=42249 RepID=A0A317SMC9_9PEZI|nr:NACHT-ANK domain protein transcript variant 4 [Tuber magnatum]